MISSGKIKSKGIFPIFVRAIDNHVAEYRNNFEHYASHTFPNDSFIIKKITTYSSTWDFIKYVDSKGNDHAAYVPSKFKFKFLTKKEKPEMNKLYEVYITSHLDLIVDNKYKIGSDPEIFVEDKDGKVIPAFNFLPDKKKPKQYYTRGYHQNIYWDGFQAEFTTQADTCLAWQTDSVQAAMKELLKLAKEHNKDAKLSIKTCMNVDENDLANGKEEHVQFGCMPSKNIYGMEGEKVDGRNLPYRSSGGHIHFGFGDKKPKQIEQIVKSLDAILGVACVALFAKYDDPKRRINYGLAGEYRLPPHGLEYRTLSNAWLSHPLIMNIVFDVARKVVRFAELGHLKFWKGTEKETIECINNCDVRLAKKILTRNKILFLQIIKEAYKGLSISGHKRIYGVFFRGMDVLVKDASDIEKNWDLTDGWIEHSDGQQKNVYQGIPYVQETKKKVA